MALNLTEVQAQQLNPLTPMAFLAPDVSYQATVAAYVIVGAVGALIWDIFIHVDSDYKLLFRNKIGIPTIVYFLSRASTLVWVLLNVIFSTMASRHCQAIAKAVCVIFHIAISSTALLFFFRARAIFNQDKFIVMFFAILWLAVLGTSLSVATTGNAVHIGPTNYCMETGMKSYDGATPIALAVNDTFVFLAISRRLLSNSVIVHEKSNIKSMLMGNYLSAFSRALLQDGQIYYLISMVTNITAAIAIWERSMAHSYCLMLVVFNVLFTNMMACQVFRHTRFGSFTEDTFFMRPSLSHCEQGGQGNVNSQIRFASFHSTHAEANQSNMNQC